MSEIPVPVAEIRWQILKRQMRGNVDEIVREPINVGDERLEIDFTADCRKSDRQ